ncbi:phosphoadenosine phosphosulfate reductase family protein [Kocuria rhizophila]|nr:phosphoadenosine phosphosulfate reductase family protein [Kocuria rhizophila]
MTGLRREERRAARRRARGSQDGPSNRGEVNAIVDWTFDHVVAYAEENLVVVNPLLSQGYPSMGAPRARGRSPPEKPPRRTLVQAWARQMRDPPVSTTTAPLILR